MTDLQTEFNSCLYHASSALNRWLGRIADHHFNAVGITPTQGFILMAIREAPGISAGELALVVQLEPSTITRTVERMELLGMLIRETDGRAVTVFPTDAGKKKQIDAKAAWEKLKTDYGRILGKSQSRFLASEVTKALNLLREHRRLGKE